MAVMYANALYSQGFAKEGFKALNALYRQSVNFEKSRIYPGIPEYFGKGGRGLYQFLTGAASWYVLTVVTKMYGIEGEYGNLTITPRLLKEQFDAEGKCAISLPFKGTELFVEYINPGRSDYGEYKIVSAVLNDREPLTCDGNRAVLKNTELLRKDRKNHIKVILG